MGNVSLLGLDYIQYCDTVIHGLEGCLITFKRDYLLPSDREFFHSQVYEIIKRQYEDITQNTRLPQGAVPHMSFSNS